MPRRLTSGGDYNALLQLADRGDVLGAYDIFLQSGAKAPGGALHLTFALGSEYAGQSFTLVHKKADGSLEYFHAAAGANGNVEFGPLYELSPFMLAKGTLAATGLMALPKTGDSTVPLAYALLGVAAVLAVARKKRAR